MRVLVIGGYGFFGRSLVRLLSSDAQLSVVIAGRSQRDGAALVAELGPSAQAKLSATVIDVQAPDFARALARLGPQIVVHTSGPFQGQDYRVASACIACGAHYIDLADGRTFVSQIGTLDTAAREAQVAVISGASSVPALSSAAVDHLTRDFARVDDIDIGISPGNRTERGLSTIQAILSYCGKRLPDAGAGPTYGWSGTRKHRYPAPVGSRCLSPCDVPDLELLPGHYPGAPTIHFGAGLELQFLHRGMNVMALMTRLGLVSNWSAYAGVLKWAADLFKGIGTDAGAMHVCATGVLPDGQMLSRTWHLVATDGDGPFVPTLAAAALIRKLKGSAEGWPGARPCIGLLTLDDFIHEARGLRITMAEDAE
ncbi:MAG: hypothetical protein CFE46_14640 [Burkholderiales bacterium PBB6]|nr:MAG: hypothetical protein CFE46_14640 [Burkholderiales bacterium PBB6]